MGCSVPGVANDAKSLQKGKQLDCGRELIAVALGPWPNAALNPIKIWDVFRSPAKYPGPAESRVFTHTCSDVSSLTTAYPTHTLGFRLSIANTPQMNPFLLPLGNGIQLSFCRAGSYFNLITLFQWVQGFTDDMVSAGW